MSRPGRMSGLGCLIVGGTGGIGRAAARRFAEEGARVVVTGLTSAETQPVESDHSALVLDARDEASVEAAFDRAGEMLGRLDVLLHVAGVSGRRFGDGPLDACSAEGWDAVMSANARSVFLTNRAGVRRMLVQGRDGHRLRGTVVNVGSVLDLSPSPDLFGTVAYAASKAATRGLTLACAARYARDGVRFQLLLPGLIATPMSARATGDPTILAYLADKQPLAGGPGSVEDCAEAALHLAEPATRFMTGAVLTVDGGWTLSEGRPPR